jgi:hypothetical protein
VYYTHDMMFEAFYMVSSCGIVVVDLEGRGIKTLGRDRRAI